MAHNMNSTKYAVFHITGRGDCRWDIRNKKRHPLVSRFSLPFVMVTRRIRPAEVMSVWNEKPEVFLKKVSRDERALFDFMDDV